jgi:hypothetical protein
MAALLFFQCEEMPKIRNAFSAMQVELIEVPKEHYKNTLKALREQNPAALNAPVYEGEGLSGSLLVMCELSERQFEKVLSICRRQQLGISMKAVMTPTNEKWNVLRLYAELEQERKFYENR